MVDGHVIRFCDCSHSYFPQCLVLLNLSGTRIKRENVDFSLFDKYRKKHGQKHGEREEKMKKITPTQTKGIKYA